MNSTKQTSPSAKKLSLLSGTELIMTILLLFFIYHMSRQAAMLTSAQVSSFTGTAKPVVVVDIGHGGWDPGKTRDSDHGLYDEDDSNKKMADMKGRCDLINKTAPALTVSIHQNSYHEESINGGQVFYYKNSENGKRLAEILQKRFDFVLGERNRRVAKANDNYYLLLHVRSPIVIVECGFLSNQKEAALLNTEEYQDRLAWTIHMGILEYLNTRQD